MQQLLGSFSNGEMTLIAALAGAALGGIIGGVVSIFTTRYIVKHGPNYDEQIEGLHETIGRLAKTQEDLRLQQEEQAKEERELRVAQERKAEEARWKPQVEIVSSSDGIKQCNRLSLRSNRRFFLIEVSLLSQSGAKIFEYPMNKPCGCSTGFGVPITHESLVLIANSSQTFAQRGYFDAQLRYRVSLETGEASDYVGELPFHAEQVFVSNTCFFRLAG